MTEKTSSPPIPLENLHFQAPLQDVADDGHTALIPLLIKLWIACQVLELGPESCFTSLILMHRYYYHRHCVDEDLKWVGASCILLGMKAEEEIRRLRDVINVTHVLHFGTDDKITSPIEIKLNFQPPELDKNYWSDKEKIVVTEQKVLRVLKFDINVSHPHRLVVLLVKDFNLEQEIIQKAWKRLNDSLFYPKALTHNALALACAAVEIEANQGTNAYSTVGGVSLALFDLKVASDTLSRLQLSENNGRQP